MKKINLLTALFFVVIAFTNAQSIKKEDYPILEKIAIENMKYKSIESLFEQMQHLAMIEGDMISEGKLYYNKPEQLLMEYTNPKGDAMLINGDKFAMKTSGKYRETSAKSNVKMQGMKNILSACLEGNMMQLGADKISCKETAQEYLVTVEFSAKSNNKSNFSKVIVAYSKKDYSLNNLKTVEADGSYTLYELKNKNLNAKIASTVFQVSKK